MDNLTHNFLPFRNGQGVEVDLFHLRVELFVSVLVDDVGGGPIGAVSALIPILANGNDSGEPYVTVGRSEEMAYQAA
jgi:hypothetical protein